MIRLTLQVGEVTFTVGAARYITQSLETPVPTPPPPAAPIFLYTAGPPLFPGLNLREREPHPAQKSARPSQEHFTTKEYARRLTWQRQSGTWIGQRFTLQRFRICRWNPPSSQGATVSVSRESILTSG
jgi:hypothetical protein